MQPVDRRLALLSSATPQAREAEAILREQHEFVPLDSADAVIVLGGDGHMLQVLHQLLEDRRDIPAYGMNRGTAQPFRARKIIFGPPACRENHHGRRTKLYPARDQRSFFAARNATGGEDRDFSKRQSGYSRTHLRWHIGVHTRRFDSL
jgi:hypothetical protein